MGNDVADINHDGYPDILSLDMLPEQEEVIKRSEGDENINTFKLRTGEYGYYYQFERNVLQVNQGNGQFVETGLMSNVAATDWSWSALFSDFDQDGHQDLFVSNGIPRRPNDLDYIKYVSSEQIANTIQTTKLVDQKALSMMPSGDVQNYVFKGSGNYRFDNKSLEWLPAEKNCSSATALGDLDNDGDLDIVINNVDDKPAIYVNQIDQARNYLKIRLKGKETNTFGVGARVYSFHDGLMQVKELYTVRGFQSSGDPLIHFGYGSHTSIDSLFIVWPDGKVKKLNNVKLNQTLTLSQEDGVDAKLRLKKNDSNAMLFESVKSETLGLDFAHEEDPYTDFNRLKLLPYQQSDRGPATATGDINNDGMTDVFFGGSKFIPSQLFIQKENGFAQLNILEIRKDSIKEDVEAIIADLNNDKSNDLLIASGGADFYGKAKQLLDTYYIATDSGYEAANVEGYYENASCIKASDFDNDGDTDLFIGNQTVSNDFGKTPRSCLLVNKNGKLIPVQQDLFDKLGMVTDATCTDYNNDGQVDLVVVGEWMAPIFLKNEKGIFSSEKLTSVPLNGLWQSVSPFDINGDGNMDFILGNWGLNAKFKASATNPLKMYYSDFDENGTTETVTAISKDDEYYPLDGFDLMSSQIVSLKKKFTSYDAFAGKTIEEIFSNEQLKKSIVYEVHQLGSGYLKNENGKFTFVEFPADLQLAPIMAQLKFDFDADGHDEVLLGGNYFGVQPFHGRYGSFAGAVVKENGQIINGRDTGLNFFNQSVRHFNVIKFQSDHYLLVTVNNGPLQVYKLSAL
ncbi:MAG TPA: VCBS repeat-containing protein, partial [Chryseosolibacter sp.]|nr:VCBS repeat-containing protein [Chryseosolibacter sp.]